MLGKIRDLSSSIIVKVFLVLLVLAFIFTGASSFNSGGGLQNEVVTVGSSSIGLDTYTRIVQQRARTSEGNANVQAIKASVMNELIQKFLFVELARELGFSVTDDVVVQQIREMQFFHNQDGMFDRNIFRRILRESGLSEDALADEIRQDTVVEMMIDPIRSAAHISQEELDILFNYYNEVRSIELVEVPMDIIKKEENPTDAQLQKYYEENNFKFQVPELRNIEYVVLDCLETKLLDITEDDVRARYESNLSMGQYLVSEQRDMQQLLFSEHDLAEQAYERLQSGDDFELVAKELLSESKGDILVAGITKDSLLNELKEPIFALTKGEYSKIIETPLGFHIFRVIDIKDPTVLSFEEVKDDLTAAMNDSENCQKAQDMFASFEDEFAGGASLKEISSAHDSLTIRTITSLDQNGNNISGNEVEVNLSNDSLLNDELKTQFLQQAFTIQETGEAMTYVPIDHLYVAFQVTNIAEPRLRSLDEIKGTLINDWKRSQSSIATLDYLRMLELEVKQQLIDLAKFSNQYDLKLETMDVKRINDPFMGHRALPEVFLHEVFKRHVGEVTSAYKTAEDSYVIAVLRGVKKAEENPFIRMQMEQGLKTGWFENIMYYYAKTLQNRYSVSINKNLVDVNL
ncbi:MAG: SurA N-terminal domain-containing protein [Rickettsiales bacterium]|nr:SurA N-terminal domain-containing protein [Rickettsiales bacterium]